MFAPAYMGRKRGAKPTIAFCFRFIFPRIHSGDRKETAQLRDIGIKTNPAQQRGVLLTHFPTRP